jgi:hypothetical protein
MGTDNSWMARCTSSCNHDPGHPEREGERSEVNTPDLCNQCHWLMWDIMEEDDPTSTAWCLLHPEKELGDKDCQEFVHYKQDIPSAKVSDK